MLGIKGLRMFVGVLSITMLALALINVFPVSGFHDGRVGMGDLHRFEAQQVAQLSQTMSAGNSYYGMGDLHLLEFTSFLRSARYSGMGDLHLFESTKR